MIKVRIRLIKELVVQNDSGKSVPVRATIKWGTRLCEIFIAKELSKQEKQKTIVLAQNIVRWTTRRQRVAMSGKTEHLPL